MRLIVEIETRPNILRIFACAKEMIDRVRFFQELPSDHRDKPDRAPIMNAISRELAAYVYEHEVRVAPILRSTSRDLKPERTTPTNCIGRVQGGGVRRKDRCAQQSGGLIKEMVNEVHLRRSVALGTIDLTIKSGVCHIELCLPNVGEF